MKAVACIGACFVLLTAQAVESTKDGTAGDWNLADPGTWPSSSGVPGETTDAMILVTNPEARFYLDGDSFTPKTLVFKNFVNPSTGEALFTARNGGVFQTGSIEQSVKYAGTGTSRFLIENATFTVTSKHTFTGGANANGHNFVEVRNGGLYSVADIAGCDANSRFVTNHFVAANATMRFDSVNVADYNYPLQNAAAFDFRNSRLELNGYTGLYSSFGTFSNTVVAVSPVDAVVNLSRCTDLTLEDSTVDGGYWQVGNQRELATLTLKGGRYDFDFLSIGGETHGNGILNLTDGAVVRLLKAANEDAFGKNGTGTVNVVSGRLFVEPTDATSGQLINLGSGAGSVGALTIAEGGSVNLTNAASSSFGLCIGSSGRGTLTMTGGTLTAAKLCLGGSARNGDPSRFTMTGGTVYNYVQNDMWGVRVDVGNNINCFKVAQAAHPCRVELNGGVFITGSLQGMTSGAATCPADGGTPTAGETIRDGELSQFLQGFATAELGEQGLTVDATVPVKIAQVFTRKAGAAKGRLVKTGRCTLTMSGANQAIDVLEVQGGTFKPASDSAAFAADVTLAKGGAYSLAGTAAAVTFDSLTVTDGMLELDPGDVVTVAGESVFVRLAVSFVSVPADGTAVMVLAGDHTGEAALLNAPVRGAGDAALTATFDAGTGKTTVQVKTFASVAPLAATTQWTGDDWAADGSWTAGVPDETTIATFDNASAPRTVAVPSGAKVGALKVDYSLGDVTFTGEQPLSFPAASGASAITGFSENTQKAVTFDVPLVFDDMVDVYVPYGGSMRFAKPVEGRGFVKNGNGPLYLEAANDMAGGVGIKGNGRIEITDPAALGLSGNDFLLQGGTLRIANGGQGAVTLPQTVRVTCGNYGVLRADVPTTVGHFSFEAEGTGGFTKLGTAKLTIAPPGDGCSIVNGQALGNTTANVSLSTEPVTYSDQGIIANGARGAFNVLEGETAVSGVNGAKTVRADGVIMVGLKTSACHVNPVLSVEGTWLNAFSDSRDTWVGYACSATENGREPTLRVVDGRFTAYRLRMGNGVTGEAYPTLAATNATVETSHVFYLSEAYGGGIVRLRCKDSVVRGGWNDGFVLDGAVDADFDNTVLNANNSEPGRVQLKTSSVTTGARASGTLAFRNGSVLKTGTLSLKNVTGDLTFAFDDAIWDCGSSVSALTSAELGSTKLEMRGRGLVMDIVSAFEIAVPTVGTGGFVKRGAGTLTFADGMYGFTGPLVAEQGVVDLSNAGTLANAGFGGGAGVIANAVSAGVTLFVMADVSGEVFGKVPHFSAGCSFTGKGVISFGRPNGETMESYPRNVLVATYDGNDNPFAGVVWSRAIDIGGGKGVVDVTVANGEVRASVSKAGLVLIVR